MPTLETPPILTLETLKERPDILSRVEWDLTPQEAIELYSLKSRLNDRRYQVRSPDETCLYFCVDTWEDAPRLLLKERSTRGAQNVATVDAPPELLREAVSAGGGGKGAFALTDPLRDWLKGRLEKGA